MYFESYNKIRELDDELFEYLEENSILEKFVPVFMNSEYSSTGLVLYHFVYASQVIKIGVFDLIEARNIYSINILFRSLLDHYLRFLYIIFDFAEQKEDTAGEHYLKFNRASEELNYAFSLLNMSEIANKDIEDINVFDLIREHHPELEDYSNTKLKKEIKKYSTKNLVSKVVDTLSKSEKDQSLDFILKLLPQYSDLSSFVHGGMGSTHSLGMLNGFDSEELTDKLEEKFKFTFLIATQILNHCFMVGIIVDEDMRKPFAKSNSILKRALEV